MTESDYEFSTGTPGWEEYVDLRLAAGLSRKSEAAAKAGLPNTLFAVCVRVDGELVGMGRVIGDGGCNFDIVDMAVRPDHQRRGLGFRIMDMLMQYVRDVAHQTAYVSLLADDWAPALYRKFGFEFTAPRTVGMALTIE